MSNSIFLSVRDESQPRRNITYTQPTELTCFTRDADGGVHPGDKKPMRELVFPDIRANLGDGYPDLYVEKDSSRGFNINPILESLKSAGFDIAKAGVRFLSFRNNFNKIMGAPYNDKDSWRIEIHRWKSCIYMNICDSGRPKNETERQKLQTFWGYKFENLCTGASESDKVNPNEEFCSIVQARLQNHRVILAAEIDCYDPMKGTKSPELDNYVELKTSVYPEGKPKWSFERFKLLSTWIQSYLVGVPNIVFGWRDFDGNLTGATMIETLSLPQRANEDRVKWDPLVCLSFTERLLSWLWSSTEEGCQYELEFSPEERRVRMTQADAEKVTFLPDFWKEYVEKNTE